MLSPSTYPEISCQLSYCIIDPDSAALVGRFMQLMQTTVFISATRPDDPFAGPVGAQRRDRRVSPGLMRPGGRVAGPEDWPSLSGDGE